MNLEIAQSHVQKYIINKDGWHQVDNHNGKFWTDDFEEITISSPNPGLYFLELENIEITNMLVAKFPIPLQYEKFEAIMKVLEIGYTLENVKINY